ncbi:MAG: glycosyltransferase family 9 protein [Candidatus Omnitrophica bacterium]|nr:glycosyltransferase family 9 protein [Candidatus Omnitrophota bacterium]
MTSIKKILVIKTDGIGDILISLGLTRLIKKLYADSKVDYLIRPKSSGIAKMTPDINKEIQSCSIWQDIANVLRMRKYKYDLVISPKPQGYIFDHMLAVFVQGKHRVGYAAKGGGFLLTEVVPWQKEKRIDLLMADIARLLGSAGKNEGIALSIPSEGSIFIDKLFKASNISDNDLKIGINIFAGHPFIWPLGRFQEVSEKLIKNHNAKIIFIGDNDHKEKVEKIMRKILFPTISFVGKTSIVQLAALIKKLDILITVDSCPRHIANAVSTPAVVLRNGANSNVIWGEYCENEHLIFHNVPCSPCGKKICPEGKRICMTSITVEEVLAGINKIIHKVKEKKDINL